MPVKRVKFDGEAVRLSAAIVEYLTALRDQKAASTVENKAVALRKLEREVGKDHWVHEISPQQMTRVWHVCGTTRGNNALIIDHQAFKHFFIWCEDMGYRVGVSPIKHITCPKPKYKAKKRVAVELFGALLNAAVNRRDRMFIALGLYLLCRKVEVYDIKMSDLDMENGEITIWRNKTGESDVLAISDELQKELVSYLEWYRYVTGLPAHKSFPGHWYLCPRFTRPEFIGEGKTRPRIRPNTVMNIQAGARATQHALKAIGFPVRDVLTDKALREGAHTLRRSGARALYDALVDAGDVEALRTVQIQLGHKHPWQTEQYIGAEPDKLKRNAKIKGKVMYPKAQAVEPVEEERHYGHLRVVS